MKTIYESAIQAYLTLLSLHIDTKTSDAVFHKASENFYETLFEVAHKLGEKNVDLGGKITALSLPEKKQKAYDTIVKLRKEIEHYKQNNEITLGTEDLLGGIANTLENIEGDARGFI